MKYATHVATHAVLQSQPLPGKPQVQNAAGGFVFAIDDWQRLRRFLILGNESGTYYAGERELTLENAETIKRCVVADGRRTVALIVEVSDKGLGPKNDPCVFALAACTVFGDPLARKLAYDALPKVCRIGTHLFGFAAAREALGGGWGRGARQAVGKWYQRDDLVMQVLKYQQRNGWSHRDPAVLDAICRPAKWTEVRHPLAQAYLAVQSATSVAQAAALVAEHRLPREFVPTQFLTAPEIWDALLPQMGLTAMVRNLGNMGKSGLLAPMSETVKIVCDKLADVKSLRASRLHPFQILLAARTYASGHSVRGSGSWSTVPQVVDALDAAFYEAFHNVVPTGKRHLLAIDVSGSMSSSCGDSPITCAEAAAAMSMATIRTEPNYYAMGFSTNFVDLGLTAKQSLGEVLSRTRGHNFGGTDTAVAIRWALKNAIAVDVFVVYTDSETWAGDQHTCVALQEYRRKTGIPAKLAVVAFTATGRSVADGGDPGSMDFVGLDASLPQALSAFVTE
jgi:60 kDa SS-A/Ro ribonucleoprotein